MPPHDIEFDVRIVTTLRAASRAMQQSLEQYRAERHGPTLLVVQVRGCRANEGPHPNTHTHTHTHTLSLSLSLAGGWRGQSTRIAARRA
jgi:hypothetical protein